MSAVTVSLVVVAVGGGPGGEPRQVVLPGMPVAGDAMYLNQVGADGVRRTLVHRVRQVNYFVDLNTDPIVCSRVMVLLEPTDEHAGDLATEEAAAVLFPGNGHGTSATTDENEDAELELPPARALPDLDEERELAAAAALFDDENEDAEQELEDPEGAGVETSARLLDLFEGASSAPAPAADEAPELEDAGYGDEVPTSEDPDGDGISGMAGETVLATSDSPSEDWARIGPNETLDSGAIEPVEDEPAADEEAADETGAVEDETAADEPAADEPAADETAADEPVEEAADETGAVEDETAADEEAADETAPAEDAAEGEDTPVEDTAEGEDATSAEPDAEAEAELEVPEAPEADETDEPHT